jgi:hypothetical protein
LLSNTNLYNRMNFTLDQIRNKNWIVQIDIWTFLESIEPMIDSSSLARVEI